MFHSTAFRAWSQERIGPGQEREFAGKRDFGSDFFVGGGGSYRLADPAQRRNNSVTVFTSGPGVVKTRRNETSGMGLHDNTTRIMCAVS